MKHSVLHTQNILTLLIALVAVAYCIPWVINPNIGLSLGGYDLAEWTSIHPTVRGSTPALLTTLLLRLPLVCLAIATTLVTFPQRPVLRLTLALLVAASLLPPIEFFTQSSGDPNYQQQFVLALLAGGISSLLVAPGANRLQKPLIIAVALIAIVSSFLGITQAYRLMEGFALPVQIGMGGILSITLLGAIVILTFNDWRKIKQGSSSA